MDNKITDHGSKPLLEETFVFGIKTPRLPWNVETVCQACTEEAWKSVFLIKKLFANHNQWLTIFSSFEYFEYFFCLNWSVLEWLLQYVPLGD